MKLICLSISALVCLSCFGQNKKSDDFTQSVNPFIGTDKMGHTFPGACVPFGMVQLNEGAFSGAFAMPLISK